MEQVTLTRAELFELLWTTPLTKLAPRFGLSDVGLAKTCERFHIPRPPQGHWARIAWNHKPDRPALPDAPAGVPDTITLGTSTASAAQGGNGIDGESSRAPAVAVAERLRDPHPVTTHLEQASKGAPTWTSTAASLLASPSTQSSACARST